MRTTTILWIAAAFWLVLAHAAITAFQTPAQGMMITSGSVLADPAGICKRFYTSERCFR